jgi:hypothetical protein
MADWPGRFSTTAVEAAGEEAAAEEATADVPAPEGVVGSSPNPAFSVAETGVRGDTSSSVMIFLTCGQTAPQPSLYCYYCRVPGADAPPP